MRPPRTAVGHRLLSSSMSVEIPCQMGLMVMGDVGIILSFLLMEISALQTVFSCWDLFPDSLVCPSSINCGLTSSTALGKAYNVVSSKPLFSFNLGNGNLQFQQNMLVLVLVHKTDLENIYLCMSYIY